MKIKRMLGRYLCFLLTAVLMLAGCGAGAGSASGTAPSGQESTRVQTVQEQDLRDESVTDSGEEDLSELTLLEVHDETGPGDLEEEERAGTDEEEGDSPSEKEKDEWVPDEDGSYSTKEEVALYIHTYGKLPSNYVTKKEAQKAGWDSKKGNLASVLPGKSIGGDRFGNYEGLLPKSDSRKYYECDVDYWGGYRSAKRIIYSNDGLIYYTEDHYRSFEQLY